MPAQGEPPKLNTLDRRRVLADEIAKEESNLRRLEAERADASARLLALQTELAGVESVPAPPREPTPLLGDGPRTPLEKVNIEIEKAEFGAGASQKDVTEAVRRHATDRQLVEIPKGGYCAAFGGDPAPGTPKRLKIRYRINGKQGDATFMENALVILPMPR